MILKISKGPESYRLDNEFSKFSISEISEFNFLSTLIYFGVNT